MIADFLRQTPDRTKPLDFPRGFGGGAKEDRTPDLYNAIVALSQLSYGPIFVQRGPFNVRRSGNIKR